MLNSDTRARIDAARDVLVGKIPDPKGQVEQITLALMYKFMNDMDREAVELGAKPQFFAKKFADYSWDRITDKRLSGVDRIKLYAEGIEAVNKNEAVPELFREIFKNAFLPYRDPETFNLFAKEISSFEYEHSEDLGDAYEYLLSIMSSQGEAGQFRTPRHIIDFMVEVVRPRLGETVLDPACGTGGFLISAYKHIRKAAGKMTPTKLEKLHKSIEGYDISPDMVRLSRVNMYLHQFPEPAVHEYDTLSDETRWADKADVILANPPFMTPKGGIRPHRKFGVKANRSEVLFVDYFMEHLTAEGRAAVIVPEGIIFQSAKAYAELRRLLLDSYLWAVASLPAGVFNPYSGVKTSILFLDRKVAVLGGPIVFAKIEADGYDLGAQRRANGKDDLPAALELLLSAQDKLSQKAVPHNFHGVLDKKAGIDHLAVPRERILAEADHSLSMERYRPQEKHGKNKWPMVKLGDVCEVQNGFAFKSDEYVENGIRIIRITNVQNGEIVDDDPKYISIGREKEFHQFLLEKGDLLVSLTGNVGRVGRITADLLPAALNQRVGRVSRPLKQISTEWLFCLLNTKRFEADAIKSSSGIAQKNLSSKWLEAYPVPLPPLSIQEEVVAEIGRYQAVIDGARTVVDKWKPSFAIDPEWPVVKLGEICEIDAELTRTIQKEKPYIGADSIESNSGSLLQIKTAGEQGSAGPVYRIEGERILYSKIRPYLNKVALERIDGYCSSDMYPIHCNSKAKNQFVFNFLLSDTFLEKIKPFYERASIPKINREQLFSVPIPLPPLSVQKEIVARIEAEREIVRANEHLIELMKKRIEETIARVWE
jgi:type I restriction enzyme M protein